MTEKLTDLEIMTIRFESAHEMVRKLCSEPKLMINKSDVETLYVLDGYLERGEAINAHTLYEFRLFLTSIKPLLKEDK